MMKLGGNRPCSQRKRHKSGTHGRLVVTVINWSIDPNSSLWSYGSCGSSHGICLEISGISHESRFTRGVVEQ